MDGRASFRKTGSHFSGSTLAIDRAPAPPCGSGTDDGWRDAKRKHQQPKSCRLRSQYNRFSDGFRAKTMAHFNAARPKRAQGNERAKKKQPRR